MKKKNHPTNSRTAGEALIALLAEYGVDTVFGIPGTHSIELYRGLQSVNIRHISPRHEQGGGFIADGYARVSGKPGVCLVISGPGVTNITTPMGEAYMDSVPMLVISPVNDPDPQQINRGRLHEITSQSAVTKPLAAISKTVTDAAEIPQVIAEAFAIFSSQRPRPVHISIPLSVIPQKINSAWHAVPAPAPKTANDDEIKQAAAAIAQANNPVIVVGGGGINDAPKILALAEKIACPLLTTVAGRGVIPAAHPLCPGAQLRASYVQDILQNADLALFLGTEFSETDHWNDDIKLPHQQIWVNLCQHVLQRPDQFSPPDNQANKAITIQAECTDFAARITAALPPPQPAAVTRAHEQCAAWRELRHKELTATEIKHWKILEIISQLDDRITIASDMTQLAYTAVGYLPMNRPRQWLHPTGYGTLGYALPAAIGAALANPDHPLLAIAGDAGLQYTMQEMTLAAELQLNIVLLLWNNNALQQIRDDMDNAGIERIGVAQKNPHFLDLAKACHWQAWRVEDPGALAAELERGFEMDGPVLVQVDEDSV